MNDGEVKEQKQDDEVTAEELFDAAALIVIIIAFTLALPGRARCRGPGSIVYVAVVDDEAAAAKGGRRGQRYW